MYRIICILFLLVSIGNSLSSQQLYGDEEEGLGGYYFGPKLGASLGTQNWNGIDRNMMFNWHAAFFMETLDPQYKGSLFAQVGYHARGSSLRLVNISQGFFQESVVWNNISLMLGAKKRLITNSLSTPYYFVGARIEYSIRNNSEAIQRRYSATAGSLFYPIPEYSNKWVYGLSFGGGYEFYGSEYLQPTVELTISPDLSYQYASPALNNIINPFNGRATSLPERNIRNLTIEFSLILRLKREVILIE